MSLWHGCLIKHRDKFCCLFVRSFSEVFRVVTGDSTLWDVTLCNLVVMSSDISEEPAAAVISINELTW
jgi:hypothetical protein